MLLLDYLSIYVVRMLPLVLHESITQKDEEKKEEKESGDGYGDILALFLRKRRNWRRR